MHLTNYSVNKHAASRAHSAAVPARQPQIARLCAAMSATAPQPLASCFNSFSEDTGSRFSRAQPPHSCQACDKNVACREPSWL